MCIILIRLSIYPLYIEYSTFNSNYRTICVSVCIYIYRIKIPYLMSMYYFLLNELSCESWSPNRANDEGTKANIWELFNYIGRGSVQGKIPKNYFQYTYSLISLFLLFMFCYITVKFFLAMRYQIHTGLLNKIPRNEPFDFWVWLIIFTHIFLHLKWYLHMIILSSNNYTGRILQWMRRHICWQSTKSHLLITL